MKRLFIIQLLKGKTSDEIKSERDLAVKEAEKVLKEPVEIIDYSFGDFNPAEVKPLWFLSKSLELLSTADIIYFGKDWDKYKCSKMENLIAKEYGIRIIEYNDK